MVGGGRPGWCEHHSLMKVSEKSSKHSQVYLTQATESSLPLGYSNLSPAQDKAMKAYKTTLRKRSLFGFVVSFSWQQMRFQCDFRFENCFVFLTI